MALRDFSMSRSAPSCRLMSYQTWTIASTSDSSEKGSYITAQRKETWAEKVLDFLSALDLTILLSWTPPKDRSQNNSSWASSTVRALSNTGDNGYYITGTIKESDLTGEASLHSPPRKAFSVFCQEWDSLSARPDLCTFQKHSLASWRLGGPAVFPTRAGWKLPFSKSSEHGGTHGTEITILLFTGKETELQ